MAQFEENILSRLAQLEQKLEAYRKLHASELDEITRGVAELREEMQAIARAVQFTSATDASDPSSVAPASTAGRGENDQDESMNPVQGTGWASRKGG